VTDPTSADGLRAKLIREFDGHPSEWVSPNEFGGYDVDNASAADIALAVVDPELARHRDEVERLHLELQGYQVGDPYEQGHEHGVQAALARLSGDNTPADAATASLRELAADFRQRAEQTVTAYDEDEAPEDECDSPAECHASARYLTWKLAARALEKLISSFEVGDLVRWRGDTGHFDGRITAATSVDDRMYREKWDVTVTDLGSFYADEPARLGKIVHVEEDRLLLMSGAVATPADTRAGSNETAHNIPPFVTPAVSSENAPVKPCGASEGGMGVDCHLIPGHDGWHNASHIPRTDGTESIGYPFHIQWPRTEWDRCTAPAPSSGGAEDTHTPAMNAALFAVALDRVRRDKGARHTLDDVVREMDQIKDAEDRETADALRPAQATLPCGHTEAEAMTSIQHELCDLAALDVPIRFWTCPVHREHVDEHGRKDATVEWRGGIAHCTTGDCTETSTPPAQDTERTDKP
jgi:hypothetical protein